MRETPDALHRLQALPDASPAGRRHFGTARGAAKVWRPAFRPAVSAARSRGKDLGVFTHGAAEVPSPRDSEPTADCPQLLAYVRGFRGDDAFDGDADVVFSRPRPRRRAVSAPELTTLGGKANEA
jgi:hypothetical protein